VIYGPKAAGLWPGGVSVIGPAGQNGADGTNGIDGRTILNGAGAPQNAVGDNGDFYLDVSSMVFYGPRSSGAWPTGVSLKGADGEPGADGAPGQDGRTLLSGTTAPTSSIGLPGDFYLRTTTNTLYGPKDASTGWPAGVSLVGPAGPQGAQGAPGASDVTYRFAWDSATAYVAKDQVARLVVDRERRQRQF
jgi:hypothetical protein